MAFHGKTYRYEFSVEVDAPIDAVRAVVTDYDHLERINNDVVQSDVLQIYDTSRLKRRMWINHCVLVFCFDLYFIEDVEILDDGSIQTTVLPAESNFKSGRSLWQIEAVSDAVTRISVQAEQTPDFWIPPLVGPIILKRAFMKEVHETAEKIELEAHRVESK